MSCEFRVSVWFGVGGLGVWVLGLGFGIWDLGFGVKDSGFWFQEIGFRVWALGVRREALDFCFIARKMLQWPPTTWTVNSSASSSSLLSLSSLDLSDTTVYELSIRALVGTASHLCEALVLELKTVPIQ